MVVDDPQTNLPLHPAVRAWRQLNPAHRTPDSIEVLKETTNVHVYRLNGVGLNGTAVIAKQSQRESLRNERIIYEQILPQLPIPTLLYYGFVEEEDGRGSLFLEEAGGIPYSPADYSHRVLAAQWLGALHTGAARPAVQAHAPDRGPRHYMEHLLSAHRTILRDWTNSALNSDDQSVLQSIMAQLDFLESHWCDVENLCEGLPQTFVHGDFAGKNMRIRITQDGAYLVPFDWETSGWGLPAADLPQLARTMPSMITSGLDLYWSAVRQSWTHLEMRDIQRMADVGRIFRSLAAIDWAAKSLAYEWVERPMRKLRSYQARLADVIPAIPLEC